ncbi:lariat debranching enzyme, C-terminal domain-containing protein [Pterulicium gracile]|uniref:Lariat debranching enzyme, C-terminal domain-containing protein n=1 Tax=Pterulicium gracile TaxID=1884261 RepID=A0A5C3QS58_9AGAR|nr:lariat debranching enzyme, C-terminal domain-containing protein [Pterula gracilis]
MKIAVEGCCHGRLDDIYATLKQLEQKNNYTVDLLLVCGDFQAVRNHRDLHTMACPEKYRALGTFHKYYTGETKAPLLTIVIGGNHEASNYMWELHHGGWVAPNIYYLGTAGCVQVNGLRIAGSSGIFKDHDFRRGFFERMPLANSDIRSIYHTREHSIRKLSLLSSPHIFLSHDWPQHIEQHGDYQALMRMKPYFRKDAETGNLGSPPLKGLLYTLQPDRWFAAHMHVRFPATVDHGHAQRPAPVANPDEIRIDDEDDEDATPSGKAASASAPVKSNPDEIAMSDEEDEVIAPPQPAPPPKQTQFLALDKCLPGRKFLEILDVEEPSPSSPPTFTFDEEWLAITRAFQPLMSRTRSQPPFPDEEKAREMVKTELEWVRAQQLQSMAVDECQQFTMTAPGPGTNDQGNDRKLAPPVYKNPQNEAYCQMLKIDDKVNLS